MTPGNIIIIIIIIIIIYGAVIILKQGIYKLKYFISVFSQTIHTSIPHIVIPSLTAKISLMNCSRIGSSYILNMCTVLK